MMPIKRNQRMSVYAVDGKLVKRVVKSFGNILYVDYLGKLMVVTTIGTETRPTLDENQLTLPVYKMVGEAIVTTSML